MSTEASSTGFRQIYYSRTLQDYWIRRFVAFIIDAVILSVATWILIGIIAIASLGFWWWTNMLAFPFLSGIFWLLYSACMEYFYGFTIGKRIMALRVMKTDGKRLTLDLAFLRNVTKIYWVLLLLDIVVALALPGDPTQKYTDRFARTSVVT
ncbi:MAG: RDD family protein [Candidatus Bathyarchaeia archaeon]